MRVVVLLGVCGMALILLSGLLPHDRKTTQDVTVSAVEFSEAEYAAEMENRLQTLLSRMEGVGSVTVMVTVSGTAEQVYAEEVNAAQSEKSRQSQNAYVIMKSGGTETPLVSRTKYPQIAGVAVLCSGGGSAAVQERVMRAVSTVLGIAVSDIYVGQQRTAAKS